MSFLKIYKKHKDYQKWYKLTSSKIQKDQDEFASDYYYVLYKTYKNYQSSNNKPFEHYFYTALKRMILTYIRKAYTSQVQFNKKVSLMNVDLLSSDKNYMTVQEVLHKCYYELNDKGVASLRFKGYTKAEICKMLNISDYEYRCILSNIKDLLIKENFAFCR